jgi:hypothetical protein
MYPSFSISLMFRAPIDGRHHKAAVPCSCEAVPNERSHQLSPTNLLSLLASTTMASHTHTTTASSSNFRLIFDNALKTYEKRTKKDLLAHPLAARLQACDSPGAILSILQQQVQELERSIGSSDDKWTKWLDPTVNVLYALSATLGEGVGLVRLGT